MAKTWPVTMGRTGIQMIENLQIYDMVWGMCNLNRFTGKGDKNVSVALHSLHCYEIARLWQPFNSKLHLYALTHDLPEAYYGDFPGFLKEHLGADFKHAIDRIDNVIFDQLGLSHDVRVALESDLKRIDNNALALEAEYAFEKFESYHWPKPDVYVGLDILTELAQRDSVDLYNHFVTNLSFMGETNEVLHQLLYSHRTYSHPQRVRQYGVG